MDKSKDFRASSKASQDAKRKSSEKQGLRVLAILLMLQGVAHAEMVEASFYTVESSSRITASGEIFREDRQTCAHPTLPFGTILKIRNPENGIWYYARVNDRGPAQWTGRKIDLTPKGFSLLKIDKKQGVAKLQIERVNQ